MSRPVSASDIELIIETAILPADLDKFANMAHVEVVNRIAAGALAEEELVEIERFLAAHLVAMRDPRKQTQHVAQATTTYEGRTGMGLDFTRYGQQVKLLDRTGAFAAADHAAKGGITAEIEVYNVVNHRTWR